MWSRKPTPVSARASPPSRSSESLICVSAVLRSFVAVRLLIGLAPNHRGLAVDGKALGAGDRVHVRRQLCRCLGGNLYRGDLATEGIGAERPLEAPRAGRR